MQWKTNSDSTWVDDNYIEFDVMADSVWHRYSSIEFRSQYGWVGNIVNFRFFPFVNGCQNIKIYIRRMAFVSPNYWRCTQPACSYNTKYEHLCPGAGIYGYVESLVPKVNFDINDDCKQLGVSIDGYEPYYFNLDMSGHISGYIIAANISRNLSAYGSGGYAFAVCEYDESTQLFKIKSGSRGVNSSVEVVPGKVNDVSVELGFYDEYGNKTYVSIPGTQSADLFTEKYRRLPASSLYQLIDSDTPIIRYRTDSPTVTMGRSDAVTLSTDVIYYGGLARGGLMIDCLGKADYYGYINYSFFAGEIVKGISSVLLLRPIGNNSYVVKSIAPLTYVTSDATKVSSLTINKFIASTPWLLQPGDVFGLWMCAPAIGKTTQGGTSAFYEYEYRNTWIEVILDSIPQEDQIISFSTSNYKVYGPESLSVYSESPNLINDIGFEIELNAEFGVDSITVVGNESLEYLYYNLAKMQGTTIKTSARGTYSEWLDNLKPVGIEIKRDATPRNSYALNDGIISAIGGSSTFNKTDSTGAGTYFYLDSDMEWFPPVAFWYDMPYNSSMTDMPDGHDGRARDWGQGYAYSWTAEGDWNNAWWDDGEERERTEFWIEIWFSQNPKVKFNVEQVISYFVEEYNLVDFCWEYYVEQEEWNNHQWHQFWWWPIKMVGEGTSEGWLLFDQPSLVLIDGKYDVTSSKYLGNSAYVTSWCDDTWPNLDSTFTEARWGESYGLYWTSLSQTFPPVKTRAVRLYCWRHYSTKITELKVLSKLENIKALSNAISMKVGSITPVFNTKTYELTTLSGETFSSSRITVDEVTEDWIYPELIPSITSSGIVSASIGSTISKIDIDIGGLDVDICSIQISPKDKSIRLEDYKQDPVTKIEHLDGRLSNDISTEIIGSAKSYTIFNDTGVEADLYVDLVNSTGISSLIYDSSLDSYDSLQFPSFGPEGNLIKDSDFEFTNLNSVSHNAKVYYLNWKDNDDFTWFRKTSTTWAQGRWGDPFDVTTPFYWNEPINPNTNWKFYRLHRTNSCNINTSNPGYLSFNINTLSGSAYWNNPTYFTDISLKENAEIRVLLDSAMSQYINTDISAGLVIFDNEDRRNFIVIERYSGNGDSVAYGDWIQTKLSTHTDRIIYDQEKLYLKIVKEGVHVRVGYRNQWDSLNILNSYDISGWNNDLRIGVFGAITNVSGSTLPNYTINIPWMDYDSLTYYVDDFNSYTFNPLSTSISGGLWNVNNPYKSLDFYSPDSDYLKVYEDKNTLFTTYSSTGTDIYTLASDKTGTSSITAKFSNLNFTASGTDCIGFKIKDAYSHYAYTIIKPNNVITFFNGSTSVSGTYTSDIWLKMDIDKQVIYSRYSSDGINYSTLGSVAITTWSGGNLLMCVGGSASNNTTYGELSNMHIEVDKPALSTSYTTNIAVNFNSLIPVLEIYGRSTAFSITGWSADPTTNPNSVTWTANKPIRARWVKFTQNVGTSSTYNLYDNLRIVSDPYYDNIDGAVIDIRELPDYKERIFKYCRDNGDYTPYYDTDYPVLVIDFYRVMHINKLRFNESNFNGRFSITNTDDPLEVQWESYFANYYGFNRKCIYSSGGVCTVPYTWGKPEFNYMKRPMPTVGYAGGTQPMVPETYRASSTGCDGYTTPAGNTFETCPLFYVGGFRWWMIVSTNVDVSGYSDDSIEWVIGPVMNHPMDPIKLTEMPSWWESDTGLLTSEYENEEAIIAFEKTTDYIESFSINHSGCPYVRFTFDTAWTSEDSFQLDMKIDYPEQVDSVVIALGKSPEICWLFQITEFYSGWHTYTLRYNDAYVISVPGNTLQEPFLDYSIPENIALYGVEDTAMMFCNFGYIEVYIDSAYMVKTRIRNLKNIRNVLDSTFDNKPTLYLGKKASLQINSIPVSTLAGTITFDYMIPTDYLSRVVDPRRFNFSVFSMLSSSGRGLAVAYKPSFGWLLIINTSTYTERVGSTDAVMVNNTNMASNLEASTIFSPNNPRFLNIVISWEAGGLAGSDHNIAMWVNGYNVISYWSGLLSYSPDSSLDLTLGGVISPVVL